MAISILDIDGTLVDTNYHHALAWFRALARSDLILPVWRIHRHIGMGDDQMVLALRDRGHRTVLASSAKADEVEHYLELLDAREIVDGWTTSADVEETKPAPDFVHAALERVKAGGDETAVMVGDTPWDIKAAEKAGVPTLAVVTGGFSEQESGTPAPPPHPPAPAGALGVGLDRPTGVGHSKDEQT
jgi:phosphoglycolate phosphatase-like HAD superfamily hydrolase